METDITTRLQILNLSVAYCATESGRGIYPVDVAVDMQDFIEGNYKGLMVDVISDILSEEYYKATQNKEHNIQDNVVFLSGSNNEYEYDEKN